MAEEQVIPSTSSGITPESRDANIRRRKPRSSREATGERSSRKVRSTEPSGPGDNNERRKKEGSSRNRVRRHKKKDRLLRPVSPAGYVSPLPIRNEYFVEKEKTKLESDGAKEALSKNDTKEVSTNNSSSDFLAFRIHYLIVHIAIMLADGLQGTHLYVLYEGYGYTVASLYCLGFVSGAITSPFIGPLVDRVGRRTSAVTYCLLEMFINQLEQYDNFAGLIASRVIGGITTNLLFTVFESWLVTEHRKRGFPEEALETVLRDSVVASNVSAILSGCIAHWFAHYYGATGPFMGAVGCTLVALILVATRWEENYGSDVPGMKSIRNYMSEAFTTIVSDSKICRIGIIQGLTEGALQTFVFLWSPALRHFAVRIPATMLTKGVIGIDQNGEPAYGLIFGAFMACGSIGGLVEPLVRKKFSSLLNNQEESLQSPPSSPSSGHHNAEVVVCTQNISKSTSNTGDCSQSDASDLTASEDEGCNDSTPSILQLDRKLSRVAEESDCEEESQSEEEKPMAVELLASVCFVVSAGLLATPILVDQDNPYAFTFSLISFLVYEFVVGLYMPLEGVLRSIYMPNDSICSLMTMLRVIVNVAVALGVISTNYIPFKTAFASCSGALIVAALLQLSLVQSSEWASLSRCIFRSSENNPIKSSKLNNSSNSMPKLTPLTPQSSTIESSFNDVASSKCKGS